MPGLTTDSLSAATRYCAVYGYPVKHSASPTMQNAGIAALGLDWRYLAFPVHPDQLREAIDGAKAMKFIGINLTVPHKLLAMNMVDVLDESARTWGAVNTIRFEATDAHGEWKPLSAFEEIPNQMRSVGFNTDADAITRSIREDLAFELRGARVLLLGAGGAGRVAALKLAEQNVAELFLVNRTASKTEEIAAEIRQRFPTVNVTAGYPERSVDLTVNATSLGLKEGDALPLETGRFSLSRCGAVYDMIYRPTETPLLKAAKAAGCRVANGIGMLLYQGAAALEIWSGKPAPIDAMRRALEKNVYGI
ncbi:MAG TPA: shikimate dehydrogenase [Candidatus Acidoferrum sp.]|nr:shikimate dehydrogenase [Candidatus Acidoferrum sp.]